MEENKLIITPMPDGTTRLRARKGITDVRDEDHRVYNEVILIKRDDVKYFKAVQ